MSTISLRGPPHKGHSIRGAASEITPGGGCPLTPRRIIGSRSRRTAVSQSPTSPPIKAPRRSNIEATDRDLFHLHPHHPEGSPKAGSVLDQSLPTAAASARPCVPAHR